LNFSGLSKYLEVEYTNGQLTDEKMEKTGIFKKSRLLLIQQIVTCWDEEIMNIQDMISILQNCKLDFWEEI